MTLGRYPQMQSGEDLTSIEWLVLARDKNKALLISQYGLDAQPYNESETNVTWEKCSLRAWLNDVFFSRAFDTSEQQAIILTTVANDKSQGYSEWNITGGSTTKDKVFLLSYAEAKMYFGLNENSNTKSCIQPTAYAIAQGKILPIKPLMALMPVGGGCGRLAPIRAVPRACAPAVLSSSTMSTMTPVLSAPLCG